MPASLKNISAFPTIPFPHMREVDSQVPNDSTSPDDAITEQQMILMKVWLGRGFQKINKPVDFFTDSDLHVDVLRQYFGLEFDPKAPNKTMQLILEQALANEGDYLTLIKQEPAFIKNLAYLHRQLGLSDAEQRLLLFLCILHDEQDLGVIEECRTPVTTRRLHVLLGFVLDCKSTDIQKAMSPDSLLQQSGLVSLGRSVFRGFLENLEVPYATRQALFSHTPNLDDLSAPLLNVVPPAELTAADFIGFEQQTKLASFYLKRTLKQQKAGANILLYGSPGTGKTQYASMLASLAHASLIEVPSQNASREPLKGEQRITLARQAGRIYRKTPRVLLFDEAEDVFASSAFGRSIASKHKAWVNDLLENCELPMVWISNDIRDMDPAFIRRFDVLVNFDELSNSDRERQFANVVTQPLRDEVLKVLAHHKPVTTALVKRAAEMAQLQVEACQKNYEQAFIDATNSCLRAQNHDDLPVFEQKRSTFSTAFIHCSVNLNQVVASLRTHKSARLCLYGPAGTGKSAFAQWVGEQLGVRVILKRGSELTGKYVGENEKRIAEAFEQAKQEHAILVFDEIDSFLSDRNSHDASWEIRSVNELLTQLESFQGMFIGSTNRMDSIDEAAMRRFDMKLHFDYLDADQRELMLRESCQSLNLPTPTSADIKAIRSLSALTPGDFAVIERRQKLCPLASCAALIQQLEEETQFKRNAPRRIGF